MAGTPSLLKQLFATQRRNPSTTTQVLLSEQVLLVHPCPQATGVTVTVPVTVVDGLTVVVAVGVGVTSISGCLVLNVEIK